MSQLFGMDNILSSISGKYDNNVNKETGKVANGKNSIGNPKLTDSASKYYEELKAKYGDMEFILVADDQMETAKEQSSNIESDKSMIVLISESELEEMAVNEMTHAKFWFEQLYGKPKDTSLCLMQAARGEYDEWHDMYPDFAKQAREEGLDDIAMMFEKVAAIERSHENRFMALMAQMMQKSKAKAETAAAAVELPREEKAKELKYGYRCQFCGAIVEDRVDVCHVCEAIGAFEYVEYYE